MHENATVTLLPTNNSSQRSRGCPCCVLFCIGAVSNIPRAVSYLPRRRQLIVADVRIAKGKGDTGHCDFSLILSPSSRRETGGLSRIRTSVSLSLRTHSGSADSGSQAQRGHGGRGLGVAGGSARGCATERATAEAAGDRVCGVQVEQILILILLFLLILFLILILILILLSEPRTWRE